MKNLILISIINLLLAISANVLSQSRLNSSASEIMEEFSEKGIIKDITKDGNAYLLLDQDNYLVYYILNEEDICECCLIIPNDDLSINSIAEYYDKSYVRLNNHKWKAYFGTNVAIISLEKMDNGSVVFNWRTE